MLTRIDHVMIGVPDLAAGMAQYRKLGFCIEPGGAQSGKGTHTAIAFNRDDYIELIAIADRAQYDRVASASLSHDGGLARFVAAGGGIRYVAMQCDDLEAQVRSMRARGVEVSDPIPGARTTPAGLRLHWRVAVLGAANPLPFFFIEHTTPIEQRRTQVARANAHPNGVQAIERVYVVTTELERESTLYARVLGMPQPVTQRGTVIMADMAVFGIGPSGLSIARPCAPGPAAEALASRGPGVFQMLCRTASMADAARSMASHGMPPLPQGVRNTGERALLAGPALAAGTYLGFVGQE